mgnify:CR=1 FL=1
MIVEVNSGFGRPQLRSVPWACQGDLRSKLGHLLRLGIDLQLHLVAGLAQELLVLARLRFVNLALETVVVAPIVGLLLNFVVVALALPSLRWLGQQAVELLVQVLWWWYVGPPLKSFLLRPGCLLQLVELVAIELEQEQRVLELLTVPEQYFDQKNQPIQ